jgi:rhomboid family GlyGly-CTERM serine protease
MNAANDATTVPAPASGQPIRWDALFFAAAVLLINLPLLTGNRPGAFVYHPGLVQAGEWWRLLTHPFAHLSWYHLSLDGVAFFLLYGQLQEPSWLKRVGYVVFAAGGAQLVSLWAAPLVRSIGLCGLSGVAHGLLAVSALEMMSSPDRMARRVAWISLASVVIKSVFEAASGTVLFAFLHPGDIGTPIAVSHAGGVLGALLAWRVTRTSADSTVTARCDTAALPGIEFLLINSDTRVSTHNVSRAPVSPPRRSC